MKFSQKNKKIAVITGLVIVAVAAATAICMTCKDKNKITAENFAVVQGDGIFYLNGGYMILDTDDACEYLEDESVWAYNAYTYIEDTTTKAVYKFVAGKVDDMKYGKTEQEINDVIKSEYGIEPGEAKTVKLGKNTWQRVIVKNYVDAAGQQCDVDIYYILKDELIYMTHLYRDDESVSPEKLLEDITLQKKPIVTYKFDSPLKIAEDGSGYMTKETNGVEAEMHVPSDVAKAHLSEKDDFLMFMDDEQSFVVCQVDTEKWEIKGHFQGLIDEMDGDYQEKDTIFKSIDYDAYTDENGREIEYEHAIVDGEGSWIFAQIKTGDKYYIVEMNYTSIIDDVRNRLNHYYIK